MSGGPTALLRHVLEEIRHAARAARAAASPRRGIYAAVFVAAATLPPALGSAGQMTDLASALYLMLAAVGLNFALGLGDEPSLGQGAFVAVGAFSVALLRTRSGWGVEAATLGAVGLAALAGALTGAAAARLRTVYVAISTWVVAWLVAFALDAWPEVSGGAQGVILGPGRIAGAAGSSAPLTPTIHYEVALVLLGVALVAFARVARGPAGLELAAVREGPAMARAIGARATRLRVGVFIASAALAGLGGAGIAQTVQVADPGAYGPLLSVKLFVAVLLGGAGTLFGPIVGVAALGVVGPLSRALGDLLSVPAGRFEPALSAALLLVALAVGRGGVVRRFARLQARRPPAPPARREGDAVTPVESGERARRPGLALEARGVTKVYGGVRALDRVDLSVRAGSVHALIGPNGSGKTTLLRVLAGAVAADGGDVLLDGRAITKLSERERLARGVARTLQRTEVWPGLSVEDHVVAGAGITRRHGGVWRDLFATPKARSEAEDLRRRCDEVLTTFGLGARAGERASALSGGDQRLLMIALAYASSPGVLLLDEPSAGMSRAHAARLADVLMTLSSAGLTMLVVEHNLRLVRYLAARVTVLEAGKIIAEGDVDEVAASARVRRAYLGGAEL